MNKYLLILLILSTELTHAIDDVKNSPKYNSMPIEFNGYIMLDHDYFSPFYDSKSNDYKHKTEIRRSKLGITFKPNEYLNGKAQIKYSKAFPGEGEYELGDAYIRIENNQNLGVQAGHMKEPFGLEQQTSSTELISIERSLPTDTFTPSRSYGVLFDYKKKSYTLAGGYFINRDTNNEFSLSNFDILDIKNKDSEAISLRITAAPIRKKSQTLHIGSSVSKRNLFENKFQYENIADIHSSDKIIRSARFYADSSEIYLFDLAMHQNNWLIQAELFSNTIQQTSSNQWNYLGTYIQASYKNTGSYRYKKGKFKSSKTNKTVWEWVVRQSYIDLEDNGIGNKTTTSLIGLNIHLNSYVKVMMNANFAWTAGDIINKYSSGNAYSMRLQLNY